MLFVNALEKQLFTEGNISLLESILPPVSNTKSVPIENALENVLQIEWT